MKSCSILLLLFIASFNLFAQDRKGKQMEDASETKKYKFSYTKTKLSEGAKVSLPKGFRVMTDGEMKQKYPNFHKPIVMLTSEDDVADFGYNISFNQWGRNLKLLKEFMKSNHTFYFKDIQYLQDTVVRQNGRDYVILEFVSFTQNKETDRELPPIRTYSYMMYTVEDNRILVFNYTCPARVMDKWKQAAPAIMASIRIDPSLNLDKATTQIPKKTKGKTPEELAKGQAKPKPKPNSTKPGKPETAEPRVK